MTTSRYLCPLDCGWHHDQVDPAPDPALAGLPLPTPDLAYVLTLGHLHGVEAILRTHLETHELLEWVQALQAAKQQLADEKARQEAYEESVVGTLNERNTRDARRAGRAEAQVAAVRAYADSLYSADRKIDACGVREKLYELLPMAPAKNVKADFRWHVLSECPDETACPIHGRNEEPENPAGLEDVAKPRPTVCSPGCSEGHTYDGCCQLGPTAGQECPLSPSVCEGRQCTRASPAGRDAVPELTAEDAVEAMQDMAGDLYRAEDRLAFVREMCDAADREQQQVTTEQVRAWTQYNGCGGVLVLPETDEHPAGIAIPPGSPDGRHGYAGESERLPDGTCPDWCPCHQLRAQAEESVAVQDMRGLVPTRVGKTAEMRRLAEEAAAAGGHVHIVGASGQTCVSGDCEATGEQR